MRRWIGRYLYAVGALHTVGCYQKYPAELTGIARDGFFDVLNGAAGRQAAFWFLMTGFSLLLIASVIDKLEVSREHIPLRIGVGLGVITLFGLVAMPRSPFWLLVPALIGLLTRGQSRPFNRG